MSNLLYYPNISIPNTPWLIQSLLYWDSISTIVPIDCLKKPWTFTPFARQLLIDGIIKTVQPESYFYSEATAFYDFCNWAKRNKNKLAFSLNSKTQTNIGENIPNYTFSDTNYNLFDIHYGKLGYIGKELQEEGILKKTDGKWYTSNYNFAKSFMTFLAVLIGQNTNYIPVTDTYKGLSPLFDIGPVNPYLNSKIIRNNMRNYILDNILPVPSKIDNFYDIFKFKEKYYEQLTSFRRHIETFIISIIGLSAELQNEQLNYFIQQSKDELAELKYNMKWFRAPTINMGTLIPVIVPSTINFALTQNIEPISCLTNIILSSIYNNDRNKNLGRPLAYAAIYSDHYLRHSQR